MSAVNVSGFKSVAQSPHIIWWNPAASDGLDNHHFDLQAWQQSGSAEPTAGRGSACRIPRAEQDWFLRHYRRGGLIGKLLHDQYCWLGQACSRVVREMAVTQKLHDLGLPAPAVVGGRLTRHGLMYRCDLITQALPVDSSMADALAGLSLARWAQIGAVLGKFHAVGLWHADLNAHNIQLSADQVWVIDFDRAVFKKPEPDWQKKNLQRLWRSVCKVSGEETAALTAGWHALAEAHKAQLQNSLTT